jgi:hypothetical protein
VGNVLLGVYTLADLEDMYKISDMTELSPEDDTVGGGILLDVRDNQMQNRASTAFLAAIKKRKLLGFTLNALGLFQFDLSKSLQWFTDIDKAMHLLMPLCHVLEGPPGRMSEEAARCLTNTESTSRALVFERQAGTGGFRTGYHKGSHVTGDHKVFLRLIPYRLFALLFALIRVVRPLELLVLSDFYVPEHKRKETFDAYSQNIFASMGKGWNATKMGSVLKRFFTTGLDVTMGVRLFRHFAVGVQRHFPKTNYGIYNTAPDERRLAYIADLMAGHSTKVAEQYYAREESVIVGAIQKADCIRICQDWHTLHGFSTHRKEA